MKVIFVTIGSRGDLNPFMSMGRILQKRGHQITVITSEVYQSLVEQAGFQFISCSSSVSYHQTIKNPDLYKPKKSFQAMAKYVLLDPMRPVYQALAQFDPKKTVVVATRFMVGARLAQEKLNFPLISVCLQPLTLWSVRQPAIDPTDSFYHKLPLWMRKILYSLASRWQFDRILAPQINGFRSELELPAISHIFSRWLYSTQKVIGLFPEWFCQPAPDWPAHTELTSFVADTEPQGQDLEPEILGFLKTGEPPVLITYGTSVALGVDFYTQSIKALRKLGYRCIILTQHPEQLPQLIQDRELHLHYSPLEQLLPHCSAIIHHGGAGTLAQAIAAALPQLIVPFSNDHPDNAARVEKLRLGLSLPLRKYSPDLAQRKIDELLKSAEIKQACLTFSEKIDFDQSTEQTCDLIEAYGA